MNIRTYLDGAPRGAAAKLAQDAGLHPVTVSQLASGVRAATPGACLAIERATDGAVTCEELRPDLRWVCVPDPEWPHPDGRPCLDVAYAATA